MTGRLIPLLLALALLPRGPALADTLTVAVAANFNAAMRALTAAFEQQTGHQVRLSVGSTGKLYAQIRHGAPFDAFFAADRARPARLEAEGRIQPGSRFTYAFGRLVLWSADPQRTEVGAEVLRQGGFAHLAIANPRLAPYGRAAQQTLEELALWDSLQDKLVMGENISHAFHFVAGGHAELGFVAWSQVQDASGQPDASLWVVPAGLYDPIEQQAVLLSDSRPARRFVEFVRSEQGRAIIAGHGYHTPG